MKLDDDLKRLLLFCDTVIMLYPQRRFSADTYNAGVERAARYVFATLLRRCVFDEDGKYRYKLEDGSYFSDNV